MPERSHIGSHSWDAHPVRQEREAPGVFPKPVSRRWPPPTADEQFSVELLDLFVHYFCLNRGFCLRALLEEFEREIIVHALDETHWNQRMTARILGIKPTTLNYKIHKMGILASPEDVDAAADASKNSNDPAGAGLEPPSR